MSEFYEVRDKAQEILSKKRQELKEESIMNLIIYNKLTNCCKLTKDELDYMKKQKIDVKYFKDFTRAD